MATLGEAFLRLRADMSRFGPELDQGARDAGDRAGRTFSGSMLGGMKGLAAAASGLIAGLAVAGFIRDATAEAREAAKVGRLTEEVIRSTGGAAKVTSGQVADLATALSTKAGVDDELIQSGANVLLTFTNVRNEVGKGNDVFNQATGLALDMSAALGQDMQSSVIQLGKALNDPIKGLTALQRVGVTFDEQQKKQIEGFVRAGDVMSAQKVILAELSKEFGGAAAAAADPAAKAEVAWGNFKEMIGGFVLPVIARLAAFFTGTLLPALQDRLIPAVQTIAGLFRTGFVEGAGAGAGAAQQFGNAVRQVAEWVQAGVRAFQDGQVSGRGWTEAIQVAAVAARGLFDFLKDTAVPALVETGRWLFNHQPLVIAVAAAYATWRAAVVAYAVGQAIGTAATVAHSAALVAYSVVQGGSNSLLVNFVGVKALEFAAWVRSTASAVAHTVALGAHLVASVAVRAATVAWTAAQWLLNAALLANPVGVVILVIVALVAAVILAYQHSETFRRIVNQVWTDIRTTVSQVWNFVLKPIFDGFVQYKRDMVAAATTFWRGVVGAWNALHDGVLGAYNRVKNNVFSPLASFVTVTIPNAFNRGIDMVVGAWNRLYEATAAPIRFMINLVVNRGIIAGWNWIHDKLGVGNAVNPISIPFAAGGIAGIFPGYTPGRDIHAMPMGAFAGGEAVMRPEWTRAMGPDYVHGANNAARRGGVTAVARFVGRYADGGIIDWLLHPLDSAKNLLGSGLAGMRARVGGSPYASMAVGVGGRLVNLAVDKAVSLVKGLLSLGGGGAAGPTGAGPGFLPWPSSPGAQRGDSGVWQSIVALIRSTGPVSGSFGNAYRPGDPLWHGSGRAVDWMGFNQDALASFFMARIGSVLELIHRTNTRDYAVTRGRNQGSFDSALMEAHRNHIHIAMDGGGYLMPDQWAYNSTSRPELYTPAPTMNEITDLLRELIDAVERVAPGVGREIGNSGRSLVQMVRAR